MAISIYSQYVFFHQSTTNTLFSSIKATTDQIRKHKLCVTKLGQQVTSAWTTVSKPARCRPLPPWEPCTWTCSWPGWFPCWIRPRARRGLTPGGQTWQQDRPRRKCPPAGQTSGGDQWPHWRSSVFAENFTETRASLWLLGWGKVSWAG